MGVRARRPSFGVRGRERQHEQSVLRALERLEGKDTLELGVWQLRGVLGGLQSHEELAWFLRTVFNDRKPHESARARKELLLLLPDVVRQFGISIFSASVLRDRVLCILVGALRHPDMQEVAKAICAIIEDPVPDETNGTQSRFLEVASAMLKALLDPLLPSAGWDVVVKQRCVLVLVGLTPTILEKSGQFPREQGVAALLDSYATCLVQALTANPKLQEGLLQCIAQMAAKSSICLTVHAHHLVELCTTHLTETPSAASTCAPSNERGRSESPKRNTLTRELALACCQCLQHLAGSVGPLLADDQGLSRHRRAVEAALSRENLNLHRLNRSNEPLRQAIACAWLAWHGSGAAAPSGGDGSARGAFDPNRAASAGSLRCKHRRQPSRGPCQRPRWSGSLLSPGPAEAFAGAGIGCSGPGSEPGGHCTGAAAAAAAALAPPSPLLEPSGGLGPPASQSTLLLAVPGAMPGGELVAEQLGRESEQCQLGDLAASELREGSAPGGSAAQTGAPHDVHAGPTQVAQSDRASQMSPRPVDDGAGHVPPWCAGLATAEPVSALLAPAVSAPVALAPAAVGSSCRPNGAGGAGPVPLVLCGAAEVACSPPPKASILETGMEPAGWLAASDDDAPYLSVALRHAAAGRVDLALQCVFQFGNERTLRAVLRQLDCSADWLRLPPAEARYLARLLVRLVCREPLAAAAREACTWLRSLLQVPGGPGLLAAEDLPGLQGALFCLSSAGGEPGLCAASAYRELLRDQATGPACPRRPSRARPAPGSHGAQAPAPAPLLQAAGGCQRPLCRPHPELPC
mmetsp:Transcript_109573/g.353659  ORF Transcript_109573/g.353659 Transcript_109573/m.353659 type:complete len:805 (-) Transcript_109573:166-2580(-)